MVYGIFCVLLLISYNFLFYIIIFLGRINFKENKKCLFAKVENYQLAALCYVQNITNTTDSKKLFIDCL